MPRETYSNTSPYSDTKQTSWYLQEYTHKTVPAYDDDDYVTLTGVHHHRPDRLSQELYGTPNYWWVFMARNMDLITDPIFDMKAGLIIRVPNLDVLR